MQLYPVLLLMVYLFLSTSLSAQNQTVNHHNHQAVIKTITTSTNPLSSWQEIVKQYNNPQAVEKAADAVLTRLQNSPAQDIYVPLLKHWQNHQAIITRPSDDHGHEVGVYLIAARASGELNRLLSEQTEHYVYAVAHNRSDHLLTELNDLYQQSHPAITSGLTMALRHLSTQTQQKLIEQQLKTKNLITISPWLAVELNSLELQNKIMTSGQTDAITRLLKAWQQNPPVSAQGLMAAAQQPGSHQQQAVALLNQVKLSQNDKDWLLNRLDHPQLGRTAARVLGNQADTTLINKLSQRWLNSSGETLSKNLLYALSRSPAGLNKLQQISQQKSSSLTKNQQQWLQQLGGSYE